MLSISQTLDLRLIDTAEADLAEIWSYIATEVGEVVATNFLDRIGNAMNLVRQSPLIGTIREQLGAGLRVTFHHPYAIYYQVSGQELIIIRVLHGARDATAIAEQGVFLH